jgi:hypothetical protein
MDRALALLAAALVAVGLGVRQPPPSFRSSVNNMAVDVHAVAGSGAARTSTRPGIGPGRACAIQAATSVEPNRSASTDSATIPVRQRTPQGLRETNAPPSGKEWLDTRYLALVERYRRGDSGAIADILTWKDAEIRAATDALSRLVVRGRAMSAGEIAARVKAAAVMLHTDAGLTEILKLRKPESLHLRTAHVLMLESAASPFGALDSTLNDFNLRNWVLAVVELLVDQMEYEPARSLLGPG